MELPPRARRILSYHPRGTIPWGTTSACAENTLQGLLNPLNQGNYLRVRGEYPQSCYDSTAFAELPPRARRIHGLDYKKLLAEGTTSACAENTTTTTCHHTTHWNYLRVRGEYINHPHNEAFRRELPPRARRIRHGAIASNWRSGTTSACAENTCISSPKIWISWNYLRVRGEYLAAMICAASTGGTTSACAENTQPQPLAAGPAGNYLRVRGEYRGVAFQMKRFEELPPRARRILGLYRHNISANGTTSACAENTTGPWSAGITPWNYLRVRGEYPK